MENTEKKKHKNGLEDYMLGPFVNLFRCDGSLARWKATLPETNR